MMLLPSLRSISLSSKFSPSNHMRKLVTASTVSSPPLPLANSSFHQDPVMADTPHSNTKSITIGEISVTLDRKSVKSFSPPRSPSCTSSADKHTKSMSRSNRSTTATTGFEHRKSKRRTRVDLGMDQTSRDNCTQRSSNFENIRSPLSEPMSPANFTRNRYGSPRGSYAWRKKAASLTGHKLDSSVSKPEFQPYDICFHEKRNSPLIGASLPGESKESCIEMYKGETKEGILRPGMVLLKHFLTHNEQVEIVKTCRELGLGPGGFYQPGYAGGAKLRLKMMCLGMDWDPQTRKYGVIREIDGSKPPSIPNHFSKQVIRAIQKAHDLIYKKYTIRNVEDMLPSMTPDICIVNFYSTSGKLGLHQDRDESRESLRNGLPVVSFSVGDSAEFLFGDERDVEKAEKVLLESGDVLIFGGESRHVFHGVSSVLPNSAPQQLLEETCLSPGRLNLTFRQY